MLCMGIPLGCGHAGPEVAQSEILGCKIGGGQVDGPPVLVRPPGRGGGVMGRVYLARPGGSCGLQLQRQLQRMLCGLAQHAAHSLMHGVSQLRAAVRPRAIDLGLEIGLACTGSRPSCTCCDQTPDMSSFIELQGVQIINSFKLHSFFRFSFNILGRCGTFGPDQLWTLSCTARIAINCNLQEQVPKLGAWAHSR